MTDFSSTPSLATLKRIHECIDELRNMEGVDVKALATVLNKLTAKRFRLLVVGEFNRGKTTLINALLGEELLPSGVVPLTSIVTILSYGEQPVARVLFRDGLSVEVPPEQLGDYVTERGNPLNAKEVEEVEVLYPSPWLKRGVQVIDTPGIGSIYSHNTDIAYRHLPQADAVLFLLSADQPLTAAERDFLADVREYAEKIFFLINKVDHLTDTDVDQAAAFVREAIEESMGPGAAIYPLSALQALKAKQSGDEEGIRKSRFASFARRLETFLLEEKQGVLVASAVRTLMRIVSQARVVADLERSSLADPLQELERKLRLFEVKWGEVDGARHDYGVLLKEEGKRLMNEVQHELERFKGELCARAATEVERLFRENRELSSGRLHDLTESALNAMIREAYDSWRAKESERLGAAFEELCGRFVLRYSETVDELFRFTSDLFTVPFSAVATEPFRPDAGRFSYKFWSEPGSMKIVTSAVIRVLPRFIGSPVVLRQAREAALERIEMQAGRIRHDLADRLSESVKAFTFDMAERLDAAAAGIEHAIARGMEQQRAGEEQAARRREELTERHERFDGILVRLQSVLAGLAGGNAAEETPPPETR